MIDNNGTDPVAKGMAGLQAASDAMRQVGGQAQDAGAQAVGQAQNFVQEAKERGADLAGDISEQASSAAETQKGHFADQLEDVAKALHRSGAELEGHQDWAAQLVERGAAELDTVAVSLRSNDMRGLMNSLQDVARRQPALFAGASLATGFALARVGRVAVSGASKTDLPTVPGGKP